MIRRLLLLLLVLALVACSDDGSDSTTTTPPSGTTVDEPDGNATTIPGGETTTTVVSAVSTFRQALREETDNGVVVHLVIPRAGFTEIDLYNFIRDFRAATPTLWRVELFDDDQAHAAFLVPEASRNEEQRTLVSRYHLLTLAQGDTIIWRGPLSSLGQQTLAP
jgi:hypothetical protein